jgi:hypothetical protein
MEETMARKKTKKRKVKVKEKSKISARKQRRKTRVAPKKKTLKKKTPGRGISAEAVAYETRGLGAKSAGQAGDTQGLPETPVGDSDSVEGLLEEGQTFEAEILEGVESARDADKSEVKTRQLPADDVPEEYLEKD